uniref:O-acyltransferase n=1 Tax=Rhizophora mucronata TaxID=61149 RepID=A0A2P2PNX0_RHIMU
MMPRGNEVVELVGSNQYVHDYISRTTPIAHGLFAHIGSVFPFRFIQSW